ncbi:MAG: hypothetical protein ACRDEA_23430 [Microcystaceae cyanobacterium]
MSTQINIRLDSHLNEKFQSKVRQEGWNTTKLVTKWIQEFVETQNPSPGETHEESMAAPVLATETLATLTKEIDFLNQKIQQLERTIVLLGVSSSTNEEKGVGSRQWGVVKT